jgi:uncharacterized protein YggU (UPF0235/DUF167 family)
MAAWPCLQPHGDSHSRLAVVVTPNAPRTMADGLHDGQLRVRLAAPPVDGKANAALTTWLAAELGLPRRAVTVLQGATTRRKLLALPLPAERVAAWLTQVNPPPA